VGQWAHHSSLFDQGEIEVLLDSLGAQRLALMDESGVNVQVRSVTTPGLHNLDPEPSVVLARQTNYLLAATIAQHPTRFQRPTACPTHVAAELARSVRQLGFKGAMLSGHPRDKSLDQADFWPLFYEAATLGVPLFIYPKFRKRRCTTSTTYTDSPRWGG